MKNPVIKRFYPLFFGLLSVLISCTSKEVPGVSTGIVMHKTDTTITVVGNVLSEGSSPVIVRGICWSKTPGATAVTGSCTTNGTGLGTYSGKATKLDDNTIYYMRAYAKNDEGTGYGEEIKVETYERARLAVVQTTVPPKVGLTSAILGGVASGYGGDRPVLCGVCWSTSPDPTMDSEGNKTESYTEDAFAFEITKLEYNQTYYFRAYVVNTKGPSYGANQTFKTGGYAGLDFVTIEGGTFNMGSNYGNDNEKPVHPVTVSTFSMATMEVSQALWKEVMGSNTSYPQLDRYPVNNVTYYDVLSFLSNLRYYTGKQFRLPTEAEWEYAAGGGGVENRFIYAAGVNSSSDLANKVWYGLTSHGSMQLVGQLQPNSKGLYDMSGNVWELCNDYFTPYTADAQTNPTGKQTGKYKVIRGGSFLSDADSCRTSARAVLSLDSMGRRVGFRLIQVN